MHNVNLIIIGASVRAAAFSALRAGLWPWCADLFGDVDLRARCPVEVVDAGRYPDGFVDLLGCAPAGPWMYTGALENRRGLIRRLAAVRPLWGNDARAVAMARSPWRVHAILTDAGLPCPAVVAAGEVPDQGRRWLVKPRAGAAGVGIRFWDGQAPSSRRVRSSYLQEYIDGDSVSAVYVAAPEGIQLLGVSRQLVGEEWLGAGPFHYCGSIGPLDVPSATRAMLQQIGQALTTAAGLRGLFGIDYILRDGVPWPVEVNPRYTASVEVAEYATGLRAMEWHGRAFGAGEPAAQPQAAREVVGKAIVYARRTLTVPAEGPWTAVLRSPHSIEQMPAFADIPPAGQTITAGRPILTFFARAADPAECLTRLRRIADELKACL